MPLPSPASSAFWSGFSRKYWEKIPGVFAITETPLMDEQEIFRLLNAYCDRCRKNGELQGLKFYSDGVRLEPFEAIEHLPVASDRSLEGYDRRMRKTFSDYGLVCDELMQVNSKNWKSLGRFVNGLYKEVGLPNRFGEMGLYLGNYRKTPFGVHVDACGVLSFPVVGKKTFRIWESNYVEKNPELKEAYSYDEFKKQSIVLQAAPGEMAYWPSHAWHIAESDGRFSCTWSIGIWVDLPLATVALAALQSLLTAKLGKSGRKTALKSKNGKPPSELNEAAKLISKISKKDLNLALEKWWRSHSQTNGFKIRPAKQR